jgi:hypothetical protein
MITVDLELALCKGSLAMAVMNSGLDSSGRPE